MPCHARDTTLHSEIVSEAIEPLIADDLHRRHPVSSQEWQRGDDLLLQRRSPVACEVAGCQGLQSAAFPRVPRRQHPANAVAPVALLTEFLRQACFGLILGLACPVLRHATGQIRVSSQSCQVDLEHVRRMRSQSSLAERAYDRTFTGWPSDVTTETPSGGLSCDDESS